MTLKNAFEDLATSAKQDTGNTTLASLLTELGQKLEPADIAALATAAKQDVAAGKLDTLIASLSSVDGHVDGLESNTTGLATQTTLAAVLAKITSDPATQTTLAAVLAKLTSDPSTGAGQTTQSGKLDTLHTDLVALQGYVDGLEGFTDGIEGKLDTLHTDAGALATQTTAAAILAKLSADPATQTTLAAILAKLTADPATETTLAALSAKYSAVVALADAITNPSLTRIASFAHLFNGSTHDRARAALGANTGTLSQAGDSLVITGTGNALNATPVAATDLRAYRWISVQMVGDSSASGITATFEGSNDNTNWNSVALVNGASLSAAPQLTAGVSASTSVLYHGPLYYRNFRVRLSAWTAGTATLTAVAQATPAAMQTVGASLAALPAGGNAVGFVGAVAASHWLDDTSTPLSGAATFTGTSRDLTSVASGSTVSNASGRTQEVRGIAVSDVSGTLHLEISRDNSTFRRIKSQATAAVGSLAVAEIEHKPKARYFRWVYVNDAGAQSHFMVQSMLMGA